MAMAITMNNTVRFVIGLVCGALAVGLAAPELSGKLPPGMAPVIMSMLAFVLHRVNADAPESPPSPPPPAAPEAAK